jgi:hypothetical protein
MLSLIMGLLTALLAALPMILTMIETHVARDKKAEDALLQEDIAAGRRILEQSGMPGDTGKVPPKQPVP